MLIAHEMAIGTQAEYATQATQLAATAAKATPAKDEAPQPLGVFGMVQGDEKNATQTSSTKPMPVVSSRSFNFPCCIPICTIETTADMHNSNTMLAGSRLRIAARRASWLLVTSLNVLINETAIGVPSSRATFTSDCISLCICSFAASPF